MRLKVSWPFPPHLILRLWVWKWFFFPFFSIVYGLVDCIGRVGFFCLVGFFWCFVVVVVVVAKSWALPSPLNIPSGFSLTLANGNGRVSAIQRVPSTRVSFKCWRLWVTSIRQCQTAFPTASQSPRGPKHCHEQQHQQKCLLWPFSIRK